MFQLLKGDFLFFQRGVDFVCDTQVVFALLWSEDLDAGFLVIVWSLIAMGKFYHSDGFFSNLLVEALQCGLWLDELSEKHVDVKFDD